MIVSIDPGDTVGIALWSNKGDLWAKMKMSLEEFIDWCDSPPLPPGEKIKVAVIEDFTLRGHQAYRQRGSKLKASQGIGVAKAFAKRVGAKVVLQQPSILNIAAMHTGTKIVQHYDDDVSAYLHGYWYFESVGILRAKPLDD